MKKIGFEEITNDDLIYFGERAEPYFVSHAIITGMQNAEKSIKYFGINSTPRWLQCNYYFYTIVSDTAEIEVEVKQKLSESGSSYVDELITDCIRAGNELRDISIRLAMQSITLKDRGAIADAVMEYLRAVSNYTVYYQITFFDRPLTALAEEVVKKNVKAGVDYHKLFDLVSVADRLTAAEYEQDDFLRIVASPREEWDEMAETHAEKYGWLSVRFFLGDIWTKEDVLKRLADADRERAEMELRGRLFHREEREKEISGAIKYFDKDDREMVGRIRKIVYLRTQRGDFIHESAARIRPLLAKVAKELGVSYTEVLNLCAPEIVLALENKIDFKKIIENRKKNFIVYYDGSPNGSIVDGEEAEDYLKKHSFLRMDTKNVSEFSGKTGYKGNLKGIVKVIKVNSDMAKVEKGDIIVTAMTTANLLPALEKASAFITDEGSITCHAAIIAREMRKPCIVGTKIATKVLKDGMMVEVDAEKGMVKIIKKPEAK